MTSDVSPMSTRVDDRLERGLRIRCLSRVIIQCVCRVSQVMGLVICVSKRPPVYDLDAHQLILDLYVLVIVLCNVPRTEASFQPLVSLSSRTKLLARIQNAFVGETRQADTVTSQ